MIKNKRKLLPLSKNYENIFFMINYHFIFLLCFLLLGSIPAHSSKKDSLELEKAIYAYQLTAPDSALFLLDKAEEQKIITPARINFLRAIIHGNQNLDSPSLEELYLRRALLAEKATPNPNLRLQALSTLVNVLQNQGKYSEAIHIAQQSIELARNLNNRVTEYELLSQLAIISYRLGQKNDAYTYLKQVINSGIKSENVRELAQVSYAYGLLINALIEDNRYEEALNTVKQRSELLERMKNMPGPPPGYIDQQKAYIYSKMANIYLFMGQKEKAEEAYQAFMQTDYSKRIDSGYNILPYLQKAQRHKDILQKVQILKSYWKDTINRQYRLLLEYEAKAAGALGDYRRMATCNERALVLTDSIYSRQKNSRAQELATLFKVNEKELQLKEEQAKAQQNSLLLLGAVIFLVLLSVLIVLIYINFRRVSSRNRIAVRQINELLEQREELRRLFSQAKSQHEVSVSENPQKEETTQIKVTKTDKYSDKDYENFMCIERLVIEQQLFLQPRFGRDELLRMTGIHKNDLSSILQRYANATNLNDYINRLRVEYAIKLMKGNKNYSIEAIAGESGFNSRSTFYRAFYKEFGMTPAQYMNTLADEKNE